MHSSFGGHARHTQSIASSRIMYPILCMFRPHYESHQHHLNATHAHTTCVRSAEIGLVGSVRIFILRRSPPFCDVFGLSPGCVIYFCCHCTSVICTRMSICMRFLPLLYFAYAPSAFFLAAGRTLVKFARTCVPFFGHFVCVVRISCAFHRRGTSPFVRTLAC